MRLRSMFSSLVASAPLALSLLACTTTTGGDGGGGQAPVLPEQERVASPPSPAPGSSGVTANPSDRVEFQLPLWEREDVQPASPKFGQTHGLATYRGQTIAVVLLEGNCVFCRSNSLVAQELQAELDAESLNVQIVILSDAAANEYKSRVQLPIFRDPERTAWSEMRKGATKHDTYVYGPDGKRTFFWAGSYQGDATRWRTEVGAEVRKVAKAR